jgi:hypothetical protein
MSDELTLVRCWRGYHDECPGAFVYWRDGEFEIRDDDPMARELWRNMTANRGVEYRLTVYDTDELLWDIDSMSKMGFSFIVRCTPHIRRLRAALASDEYLTECWLAAEKNHLSSARSLTQ